jgi:hypothetical protein
MSGRGQHSPLLGTVSSGHSVRDRDKQGSVPSQGPSHPKAEVETTHCNEHDDRERVVHGVSAHSPPCQTYHLPSRGCRFLAGGEARSGKQLLTPAMKSKDSLSSSSQATPGP